MIQDGYRQGSFLSRMAKRLLIFAVVAFAILAFCLHGFSAFGLTFDPFHHLERRAAAAQVEAQDNHGLAVVAQAGEDAGIAALKAYDAHAARGQRTDRAHQENSRAILSQPGAQGALDPDLARTVHDGLCKYHVYDADPGCDRLQDAPPGSAPPGHAGRAAP